jgi:DNA integrity scanning protein DisA with diadenylate cyclase activity
MTASSWYLRTKAGSPDAFVGTVKTNRRQKMRVAIYARVSIPDGKGQSPEMQLRELREHCDRRRWQIVGEYVDQMTGTKDSRPQLDRLMAECAKTPV